MCKKRKITFVNIKKALTKDSSLTIANKISCLIIISNPRYVVLQEKT